MVKRIFTLIIPVLLTFIFTGCSKLLYVPNMQPVHLVQEKNEVNIVVNPQNAEVAYSPMEHVVLLVNGYASGVSEPEDVLNGTEVSTKRLLVEGGAGYYDKLGSMVVWELYGTGGYGKADFLSTEFNQGLPSTEKTFATNMYRFTLQPNIGVSTQIFDIAFSTRLVGLKYSGVEISNYTEQELKDEKIFNIDQTLFLFVEPAITFRVGYKYVKAHVQVMYSNKLNSTPLNYRAMMLNFGLNFNINPRDLNDDKE